VLFDVRRIMKSPAFDMNDLLLHPFRAASAVLGVLLAVVGYIFFEAPILMIPASLLALRFLTTPTRSLQILGLAFLVLIFVSHNVKRSDFKDGIPRDLVVNCALTFLVCKRGPCRRLKVLAVSSHSSHTAAHYDCYE
jgi:hypothetical protein